MVEAPYLVSATNPANIGGRPLPVGSSKRFDVHLDDSICPAMHELPSSVCDPIGRRLQWVSLKGCIGEKAAASAEELGKLRARVAARKDKLSKMSTLRCPL
jgi:hypothetical protein